MGPLEWVMNTPSPSLNLVFSRNSGGEIKEIERVIQILSRRTKNNPALIGEPGSGKFQFLLTGRHMTLRCDGDSAEHVAFGGPIFYGHDAGGFNEEANHKGNVFWPQAVAASNGPPSAFLAAGADSPGLGASRGGAGSASGQATPISRNMARSTGLSFTHLLQGLAHVQTHQHRVLA